MQKIYNFELVNMILINVEHMLRISLDSKH